MRLWAKVVAVVATYIRKEKRNPDSLITIAEYLQWRCPAVLALLEVKHGITQVVAARETHGLSWWKRIMEEKPKYREGGQ